MYFKPINLRVDNMPSDRYAVCTKAPVFSWGIEHEDEKALQRAYIIKVWDGEKLLWDSGRIETPACEAEYKGIGLKPQMRIKWQLTLEDNANRLSSAAEGIFKVVPEELDAEWICEENNEESRAVYFAKQFVCGKEIFRATLYACGIGYQDIRINGKKADDAVLQPMVSNFSRRCFFVTLEAEDLLNTGENCIGIKVGDGWRRNYGEYLKGMPPGREVEFFGVPQLAAKLVIEYADGSAESIATDVSWYAFSGGTVKNHLFDGEVFDARSEPAGWDAPGFDYSNVKHASPAKPAGKLIPQFAEPIKIQDRIAPISKTMIEKGVYIFDFGVNIAGYAEIRIPEGIQAGEKITLKFSEEIKEDGIGRAHV